MPVTTRSKAPVTPVKATVLLTVPNAPQKGKTLETQFFITPRKIDFGETRKVYSYKTMSAEDPFTKFANKFEADPRKIDAYPQIVAIHLIIMAYMLHADPEQRAIQHLQYEGYTVWRYMVLVEIRRMRAITGPDTRHPLAMICAWLYTILFSGLILVVVQGILESC